MDFRGKASHRQLSYLKPITNSSFKNVLIAGGSKGLGRELAIMLTAKGLWDHGKVIASGVFQD